MPLYLLAVFGKNEKSNISDKEKQLLAKVVEQIVEDPAIFDGVHHRAGAVHLFELRDHGLVKLHPLEPANSPTLTTGHKVGRHRIQGISDEFIPPIVDLECADEVIGVDDGDAILGRDLYLLAC